MASFFFFFLLSDLSRNSTTWSSPSGGSEQADCSIKCYSNPYLVMGQPSSRENGDLLASGNTVHPIDSRNASLDHFFWVDSTLRIDRLAYFILREKNNPFSSAFSKTRMSHKEY